MDIQNILENGANYYLPNLSIDIVIIGYQDDVLKCLLVNLGDKWALPGGYIKLEESVVEAAERTLMERTRLQNQHLKFLSVVGEGDRKFAKEFKIYFEKHGLPWKEKYWINNRFVSLAYYALVDINKTHPASGDLGEVSSWFSTDDLPEIWMDHESIITTARQQLKIDIKQNPVTYNLLPDQFTMPELHQLHETILEEKIDRSRFQKNMLASGLFERLPKLQKETPGRNPYLYTVKKKSN